MPWRHVVSSWACILSTLAFITEFFLWMTSMSCGVALNFTGVYNTSKTPESLPWNTYNYCNAPHVNIAHYYEPTKDDGAELIYMNVIMRHHKVCLWQILSCFFLQGWLGAAKRTPDNLYPNENELNIQAGWECTGLHQQSYGGGTAPVFHETVIPPWHPYISTIWNGTCDAGQLTQEGLEDAIRHGKVSLSPMSLTPKLMFFVVRISGLCITIN